MKTLLETRVDRLQARLNAFARLLAEHRQCGDVPPIPRGLPAAIDDASIRLDAALRSFACHPTD